MPSLRFHSALPVRLSIACRAALFLSRKSLPSAIAGENSSRTEPGVAPDAPVRRAQQLRGRQELALVLGVAVAGPQEVPQRVGLLGALLGLLGDLLGHRRHRRLGLERHVGVRDVLRRAREREHGAGGNEHGQHHTGAQEKLLPGRHARCRVAAGVNGICGAWTLCGRRPEPSWCCPRSRASPACTSSAARSATPCWARSRASWTWSSRATRCRSRGAPPSASAAR